MPQGVRQGPFQDTLQPGLWIKYADRNASLMSNRFEQGFAKSLMVEANPHFLGEFSLRVSLVCRKSALGGLPVFAKGPFSVSFS
jgi:hypothetical protein